jgi:GDPmannose 4,6-dehydratase
MKKTKALICGITGQDGGYLARLLIQKGYEVFGTTRNLSQANLSNLRAFGIVDSIAMRQMSISDYESVLNVIASVRPDEIYNLSGQSSVHTSFSYPTEALSSISVGTLNILEVIKLLNYSVRFFNACSSECFGDTDPCGADENTAFHPRSPYAIAKAAAYWHVADWRSAYDLYACSGILFNHESPLRPETFVTQKIVRGAAMIARGELSHIELGNLNISRDWGWAPDYVDAMWRILQQAEPSDFVIATGKATTLKKFINMVFNCVGLDWEQHVVINPSFLRPLDINYSVGNSLKASDLLDWRSSTSIEEIVSRMLANEILPIRRNGGQ